MNMTRRERVQTITRDWGFVRRDGWQALVKEELRALYAREKLLEAVVSAACLGGLRTPRLLEAVKALDSHDKENPR